MDIKQKAFEFMDKVQGWNLDDYNAVFDFDYDVLDDAYTRFDSILDHDMDFNNTITRAELEDIKNAIGFMIDYVYAVNNVK